MIEVAKYVGRFLLSLIGLAFIVITFPIATLLELLGRLGFEWAVPRCRHCEVRYRWGSRACQCLM